MAKQIPFHLIPDNMALTNASILEIVNRFGSPIFIYDSKKIKLNWEELVSHLPKGIKIFYSVKANPSLAIIKIFEELGANFEVASTGELKFVLHVGVSPSRIIFIGPGKTIAELDFAIDQQIYAIVCESLQEVIRIQENSAQKNRITSIALRINPGQGKGMLAMGGETQFGMDVNSALNILQTERNYPNIRIIGVQGYLGTQVLDWKVIIEHSHKLLNLANELQLKSGKQFTFIDLGGGFGTPYHDNEVPLDLENMSTGIFDLLKEFKKNFPQSTDIAVESGRFLISSSGVFVAKVIDIKKTNNQTFIILDGGINVFGGFDRYAGSRPIPIRFLGQENSEERIITLCGPLCTPLDRLAASVLSPVPSINSLVVFYMAGAYGYTASPGLFLSHGYPSEILFINEEPIMIRKKITPEEVMNNQYVANHSVS